MEKILPTSGWSETLGSGGAGDAVFQQGDQLFRIGGWRQTGVAGADDGESFAGGEMRESFFEGAGEMELWSFGSDAEDGFAEAEDAVGGGFEGLGGGIIRIAGDDDLQRMIRKKRGGEAVGGGGQGVLPGGGGERFR